VQQVGKGKIEDKKPAARRAPLLLRRLGPGLITGAADDDPSGIATYSQAGAQFGYGLLWTVFLTTPFMIAIQLVSGEIGRVTGKGIAANLKEIAPQSLVVLVVGLLAVANIFNIAADLAAMGEAARLVVGGINHVHALLFAVASVLLQLFVRYQHYASVLKFLTLVLFCYVATAFTVHIPWGEAIRSAIWPAADVTRDYLMMIVAVLGTTISPYLFFWQASEEVEEMHRKRRARPLKDLIRGGAREIDRITVDTTFGMLLSNVIAFFIILSSAAVLNAHGITTIRTAADAAEAFRPLAGELAFVLFALGIVGTGLLAIPVLAGSAAYALAEAFNWPATLSARVDKAARFYGVIAAATLTGFALGYAPIDPIRMLIWSAVLNGIVAVPVMAAMMMLVTRFSVMGRFTAHTWLLGLGWMGTALMTITVAALFLSYLT
jgi:NRAMP (natural resistance-associated macrophage protein)-like metal ion transporter